MIDNLYHFVLLLCVICITFIFTLLSRRRKNSPPGPYGLPIVGYYPFFGEDPIETLHKLSKKYDNIMSINLFGEYFWILNSYESIEEAFITKGDIFAARPKEFNLFRLFGKSQMNSEGDEWKAQSKFVLGHLSQLGMGKSEFEITIHNIFDNIEKQIDEQEGKPYDISNVMNEFTVNVVTTLICSKQFKQNDVHFKNIRKWCSNISSSIEYFNVHLTGTLFKTYLRLTSNADKILHNNFNEFRSLAKSVIKEREENFDVNNCKDLLDYWLKECKNGNNTYIKYENLPSDIAGFILAGADTPAGVLIAGVYIMATMEEVQRKVYEEISETIGTDGLFCYLDRKRMPYTQAVIAEIQRFVMIAPLANFHVNRSETTLQGYNVPKRQKVIANFYALSRNEKYFANANEFDPKNFLHADGKYKPSKMSLPFGVGVRKCTGLKLSEVEIFIAFVRLMRKYEWCFPVKQTVTHDKLREHLFKSFEIRAVLRQ